MKKLNIVLVALFVFGSSLYFANAQTANLVSVDVADLPAFVTTKNLYFGQSDPEVKRLQQYLVDNGFLDPSTTLVNRYGEKTRQAVKLLQIKLGINSNGANVGPMTRGKLGLLRGLGKKVGLQNNTNGNSNNQNSNSNNNPNDDRNKQEPDRVKCEDGVGAVNLASSLTGTSTPPYVVTTTGGVGAGNWMDVMLSNTSLCPVTVTKMTFALNTNELSVWAPVQNVKLMHAGVQLGAMLERYDSMAPAGTAMFSGPGTLTFSFPGAYGVTINPGTSQVFKLISDSRNVPSDATLTTSASGVTTITGTPYYFAFQLTEFTNVSSLGVVNNQSVVTGTIPGTIITPNINIYQ